MRGEFDLFLELVELVSEAYLVLDAAVRELFLAVAGLHARLFARLVEGFALQLVVGPDVVAPVLAQEGVVALGALRVPVLRDAGVPGRQTRRSG